MSTEIERTNFPPRIKLPRLERPTRAEINRRRRLFAKVMRLREKIGPIGQPVTDFIREDRDRL